MSISFLKDCLQIFDYFKNDIVGFRSNFVYDQISFELSNYMVYSQVSIVEQYSVYTRIILRYIKDSNSLQITRAKDTIGKSNFTINLDDFEAEDDAQLILIHGRKITNSSLFEDNSESSLKSFENLKTSKLISHIFDKE